MIFGLLASSCCVYICVILEREFLHCLLKASHESRPLASTKNIGKELATIDDNQQKTITRRKNRVLQDENVPAWIDMTIAFTQCSEKLGYLILQLAKNFIVYMAMVLACNGLHFLLKPYSQPRITSDIVVGLVLGNIPFLRKLFDEFNRAFGFIIDFGMMCYMFALGIEMDPYVLFKRPNKDALVAYCAIFSTFAISITTIPFLHFFSRYTGIAFTISISALLASSASPVLTRLITNLKIGKSDIGKLVIAAGMHSDLICLLVFSLCYIFMPTDSYCIGHHRDRTLKSDVKAIIAVVVQTSFTAVVSPVFLAWVNNENPEGRPMKGSHLVLSVAFMALICAPSTLYDFSPVLSAFMTGICLPRDGRVSKWIISKINYILSTIFFPIFFLWMGNAADVTKFRPGDPFTWLRFFLPLLIVVSGKVIGTLISGAILGFNWRESVLIGMLLVTKGHFQIYMAIKLTCHPSTDSADSGLLSVAAIFFAVVHSPVIVAQIIRRARKRAPTHTNALQLLKPSSELRIFLCLHGLDSVPASINFMEISRGISDPGLVIYVAEIIELTEHIASTMESGEGVQSNTIKDKAVIEMREQITNMFQAYIDTDGDGITLKRAMALSTINNMAQNICVLAENLMAALIILPFHRNQRQDGKFDTGNPGFRYVNRKLLKNSPCSVGILVNRGFGSIGKISRTEPSVKVAAIFIGGRDDREALCYVGRVAWHKGVHVTVIRFLVDTSAESSRLAAYRVTLPEQEQEMGLDDECFAQFYEQHIVGGRISYLEKHLANASETFSTLRSFEGEYSLVIVGREGGANSILTKGMNDWQQCPELGPIGDVLSGPDFSKSVSVLIIQQHKLRGELAGLDEDFTIM
ncbi:Cation/H+ exchanger [Vigna unguiculata]|uniref:Cation/H+ exchanger n=1 Tax=Vigna unguiculata TaxID=3917 RepID=A0A4D6LKB5_VIGUN|nr:Cation/H+ exchanger [Vigna unguiculata]